MNWWLILARGAAAPVAVAVAGILLSAPLRRAAESLAPGSDLQGAAQMIPWVGFAGSLALLALFYWRLWAWESGQAPSCRFCDGPVGRLRDGVVMCGKQLPDYRRCYNCGRDTPEQ